MAKRTREGGYVNPVAKPDPVFQPASDQEHNRAKGLPPRKIPVAFEPRDDSKSEIQNSVKRLLDEAIDYYQDELEPDQIKATEYYKGDLFGDEKEGRSKVVNTVVRDAVLAAVPSLMRIIYEADRVAEYLPRPKVGTSPEELAKLDAQSSQATDYVRYIVSEDNPGFQIFWDWIMDGLVRRIGTVKWWWDEVPHKVLTNYTGLTEQEVQILASDESIEIQDGYTRPGPDGGLLYDISAYHIESDGRVVVRALPNEEFVFTPDSQTLADARLVAHVREIPSDELVTILIADGMDPDDAQELVEEHQGKVRDSQSDTMNAARQFDGISRKELMKNADDLENVCLYVEAYVRMKLKDDEGDYKDEIAPELRVFKCVGPSFEIINGDGEGECVDDLPFACWTPIPEPHTIVGQSFYDLLKDIQRIISQIERGTLDSLAQSITPVTEVVSGMVNMQDFINPEIAGVRRVRAIGQTNNIVHHFVGGDTLPVLGYYNQVIEDRTGKNKGAMGLDADALQSTTKVAAASILSASQARVEIIARVFAETGLKALFRGLLKLVTKHQSQARMIRLRGAYVEIDPRPWDATMDVQINVALGAGTPTDKIEVLAAIAGRQQELLATGSPLVSNIELRHTLGKITELSGQKNTELFFKSWGEQEEQQLQEQMAQQPPPPDANMALVEVEKQKAAAEMVISEQKFQLDKWKAEREDDRERDKIAQDGVLREIEIEKKYNAEIIDTEVQAKVAAQRAAMDAGIQREKIKAMSQPRTVNVARAPSEA